MQKKSGNRTNRGFTILEIAVAIAVLLLISSIAFVSYTRYIDRARERVCQENLDGLRNAIQIYVSEKVALPATLGELKLEHLKRGYDLAMKNATWETRLARSITKLNFPAEAHAFSLTHEDLKIYGASKMIFRCPADHNGGASYAINTEIAGLEWTEIDSGTVLIAESDSYTFSDVNELQHRHESKKMAFAIVKTGRIIKLDRDTIDADGDDDDDDSETICHKPGTPAEKTMTKSGSALADHLAHGDTVGACP